MIRILTIGHSTRTIDEFLDLLAENGVRRLMDVRTVPRSQRHPQFNRESMPLALAVRGIGYQHVPALGGMRRARPDSVHQGWKHDAFRGFADHMETQAFEAAIEALVAAAARESVVIMCAEAVPWRCHRSLISDALVTRGVVVEHILGRSQRRAHELTAFARVEGRRVSYPAAQTSLPEPP